MIPYYPPLVLHIGGWRMQAFNLTLILAVALWTLIALRRAPRLGIDRGVQWRMCFWAVVSCLIGAHIAKVTLESWPEFVADPTIVFRQGGIRSIGGLFGGLAGVAAYARFRNLNLIEGFRILENITFSLPFPWIFGRLGCFLVHDHKGEFTSSWIAVQFPEGTRYDLGLVEFFFLIPFSALFFWLDRRPRPLGFFFGLYCVGYGAFRIWLDTLLVEPFRFYLWILVTLIGISTWIVMWKRGQVEGFWAKGPFPEPSRAGARGDARR